MKRSIKVLSVVIFSLLFLLLFYNFYVSYLINIEAKEIVSGKKKVLRKELYFSGKSPAILLIHGFGGSPYDFKPLFKKIVKNGNSCYVPLLPFHGTTVRDMDNLSEDKLLNKIEFSYKKLKAKNKDVIVGGFSMGGALTLIFAKKKKINKIFLCSPYFRVTSMWSKFGRIEKWASFLSKIVPYIKKLKNGQIYLKSGEKLYRSYSFISLKSVAELYKIGSDALKTAPKIDSKILWFHSKKDLAADYNFSKKAFNSVKSKEKTFVSLKRSNHVIMYDYDSSILFKKIINFINK